MPFPEGAERHARNLTNDPKLRGKFVNVDAELIIGYTTQPATTTRLRVETLTKHQEVPVKTEIVADPSYPGLHWLTAKQGLGGAVLYTWFEPSGTTRHFLACARGGRGTVTARTQTMNWLANQKAIWRAMHATGMPERVVRGVAGVSGAQHAEMAIHLASRILYNVGSSAIRAQMRAKVLVRVPEAQLAGELHPHPASTLDIPEMKRVLKGAVHLIRSLRD